MKPNSFHRKILYSKKLPRLVKFTIIIFTNWCFHGFLYMERSEKIIFLFLDLIFFLPFFFLLSLLMNPVSAVFCTLAISHTLHWLFNGHLYVLLKNLGFSRTSLSCFVEYLEDLSRRAKNENSIDAILVLGSLSRGVLTERSDLDIRIIRLKGFVNGVRACTFAFLERVRALLRRIPLDIYTCDDFQCIEKLDERPIIIYRRALKLNNS
ncbi:MAG: nucleotidyltransferase domain-containing protein [Nitrososphaerales archaeon]